MPLIKSSSKAARQKNIRRLIDEGYPPMQAVAIAYSTQRAAKAKNRAGFSGEPYTVRTVGGGLRLYVSRIGNRAAAYSPHDGFTVFGMMDAGELRVAYGKKGKHYATPKTAEAAIRRWILEERRAGANMAGRRSAADRLFIGVFPGGISYADRARSEHGDYARVAFLPYDTLELKVSQGADPKLIKLASEHAKTIAAKRGQPFSISASGQTVTLGSNKTGGRRRNRAGDPLAELVTALRNNADAYHERRLDHDAFARRNRYIWSQIEAMGERAQDRALAMLRSR